MARNVYCCRCHKKIFLNNSDEQKIMNLYGNDPSLYNYAFDHFLCKDCLDVCEKQRVDLDLDCD